MKGRAVPAGLALAMLAFVACSKSRAPSPRPDPATLAARAACFDDVDAEHPRHVRADLKRCDSTRDCAIARVPWDACGTELAVGVAQASGGPLESCRSSVASASTCTPKPLVTESDPDAVSFRPAGRPTVTCAYGRCTTYFEPADVAPSGHELDAAASRRGALSRYGWVDRDAGIARIPIEAAMGLVVDGGAPAP